jgi:AcrR family transcriptional regulator
VDAKTQKSEMTRTAIVGAAMDLASAEGLEAITLQAVATRLGLSKSGVFSRVGSREALQKAVIEEFGRRFLADVFVPAMQKPKGLARLDEIVSRWIVRTRDLLLEEVTRWRAALRRTELQAIETGELKADTDPAQLVSEINGLIMALLHDARFLRDPRAADRAVLTWQRLVASYRA